MSTFNLDPELIYFNHAAVAPWPDATVRMVQRFAEENGRLGASLYAEWLKTERRLHQQFAQLLNVASPDDVAVLKNTSEGLSLIARGLNWSPGDNIVSILQEFPSNRIVWEALKPQGVEIRQLDLNQSSDPESDLIALCDERTRLLTVSSVQYASGLVIGLRRLGRHCRENGILFCVDAIQSLGAAPFDITECDADFVVADGHKWMLGPEGVALFYCRPEQRSKLSLQQYGWHMVQAQGDFDRLHWEPADTARRFECGSPNMLGIHALSASLEVLLSYGIESVAHRIQDLTENIITEVDRHGFELLTPREPKRRAGIVTFRVPGVDQQQLQARLQALGVVCAFRGGGIRFSPHFHNTQDQVHTAFQRLTNELRHKMP